MERPAFEDLPLLPWLIAETCCKQEYTGQDLSDRIRSGDDTRKVEELRKKMTPAEIEAFGKLFEEGCKMAYAVKADWFEKCVKSHTTAGRDQLYIWAAHWLHAHLLHPGSLERMMGGMKAQTV